MRVVHWRVFDSVESAYVDSRSELTQTAEDIFIASTEESDDVEKGKGERWEFAPPKREQRFRRGND